MGCKQEANLYRNLFKSFFIVNKMDSVYSYLKIRQYLYADLFSMPLLIKIQLRVEQWDHQPVVCWGLTKVAMTEVAGGNYLEAGEKIVLRLV